MSALRTLLVRRTLEEIDAERLRRRATGGTIALSCLIRPRGDAPVRDVDGLAGEVEELRRRVEELEELLGLAWAHEQVDERELGESGA